MKDTVKLFYQCENMQSHVKFIILHQHAMVMGSFYDKINFQTNYLYFLRF